jgi:hypothetical protein
LAPIVFAPGVVPKKNSPALMDDPVVTPGT